MESLPASSSPSSIDPSVRTWTVLCHASAFLGFLIPALGQFVGPLIVWLWKRGDSPEIDAHGKESLNFQLSVFIYTAVFAIVCFVLMFVLIGLPACSADRAVLHRKRCAGNHRIAQSERRRAVSLSADASVD